ncbi:MAG TPA: efflux RND transporter periplasmic adaptor subunit [Caldimonas sp.]|nr:efflux RND transporter periplasmic adaptor subunit [Caldimonas sp.]
MQVAVSPAEPAAEAAAPEPTASAPSAGSDPRRRRAWGWGAVVAVAIAAALAVWALPPRVTLLSVVQRDFVQTVVASGHVEAPHRVSIGAQIVGNVVEVPVAEGQTVVAGQVLVLLDARELQAAADQADLAVEQARLKVRSIEEVQRPVAEQALRQAQVNLDNARAAQARAVDLFRQGFIGQAALDDAQKAADLADSQLRSAAKQLEALRAGGSDERYAQAALAQARASAEAAQARLRYTRIAAPVAGVLIARDVEPGDVAQPGKALMTLSPLGTTELVVQIDERNLGSVAIGQKAQASADAFPDRRFAAEVNYINPGIDAQRGSVEVKLRVPEPPDVLKQDMTVSVDIEVARRPHAVLVPIEALHDAESAPWVLRVENDVAARRAVKLGLRGSGHAEVLDGLAAGDRVVPASARDVRPGERVRPAT